VNEGRAASQCHFDHPIECKGRGRTGVLALACTGGPDTATAGSIAGIDYDTTLYYSKATLGCYNASATPSSRSIDLPLNLPAGNHNASVTWNGTIGPQPLQYATYFGTEQLNCGTAPTSTHHVDGNKYYCGNQGEYYAQQYGTENVEWVLYSGGSAVLNLAGDKVAGNDKLLAAYDKTMLYIGVYDCTTNQSKALLATKLGTNPGKFDLEAMMGSYLVSAVVTPDTNDVMSAAEAGYPLTFGVSGL